MSCKRYTAKIHRISRCVAALNIAALAPPSSATTADELRTKLDARFKDDRTGA
jgi:hypothetical protein